MSSQLLYTPYVTYVILHVCVCSIYTKVQPEEYAILRSSLYGRSPVHLIFYLS